MSRPRISIVHNILPPYRIAFFNAIAAASDLQVVVSRITHPRRRRWHVPRQAGFHFRLDVLRTVYRDYPTGAVDISVGTRKVLQDHDPDVVVLAGWNLPSCWTARHWAQRQGIPFLVWTESNEQSGIRRGSISGSVRKFFLRDANAAIVPGTSAGAFVSKHRPDLPIAVVPNSVGDNGLINIPSSPSPTSVPTAMFFGELSERKGFDLFVHAVPLLREAGVRVSIFGSGPLESLARSVRGAHFGGFVVGSERLAAFEGADVVVVPSRRDPWPLVAVETLAAGRRLVLAPSVGSSEDLNWPQVRRMVGMSPPALVNAVESALEAHIDEEARTAYSAWSCAEKFLQACEDLGGPGVGDR